MKAWFVTSPSALEAKIPGGVQLCSQEFLSIVRAGFPETEVIRIGHSRAWSDRLHKRFGTAPYRLFSPQEFQQMAQSQIQRHSRPAVVFLNMCETTRLAKTVKLIDPAIRVVLLSHGTQTGDDLYEASGKGGIRTHGWRSWWAPWKLGSDLCLESMYRRNFIDCVGAMSEEECVLERWLGASETIFLPRVVKPSPLKPCPVTGRVGYVGTLDHTPNIVGLEQTLRLLGKRTESSLEVRVVGGPEAKGRQLQEKFPTLVRYLGPLGSEALAEEAATWSVFINPIYWLSKGASMKLGQALAWKIPFVSTRSGARGYSIPGLEDWITDDTPEALVNCVFQMVRIGPSERNRFEAAWEQSHPQWPTIEKIGHALKTPIQKP